EWAAAVAEALLRDTLARLSRVQAQRLLVFTPADARDRFASLASDAFELIPQSDGDLGQRLRHFMRTQLGAAAQRSVVVGRDSATMPVAFVEHSVAMLKEADVVLGPAADGGYYLLGCGRRLPPIFDGIAWGGLDVLSQTIARLSDLTWRVALLPPWYDVDTL